MKNLKLIFKTSILTIYLVAFLSYNRSYAQVSALNNNPLGGAYLGWNGAQNLEFRTNNLTHMQVMQTGNSTINGFTVNRSGFIGLSQNPAFFTSGAQSPFSLLHLNGDNNTGGAQELGYRDWMRYGITFTHNQDFMFIGQRRMSNDVTDAVIAWADNAIWPGPDNLCFVFTSGDGTGSGTQSSLGREIGRMTAFGHTGLGIQWNNTLQPKRTLDVIDSIPQARITRFNNSNILLGTYTDFETSNHGHLHILPKHNGDTSNVAIGFLADFESPTERLDVDGTARLRQVPSNSPNVLITGVEADADGDYVLNHLDFSGSATQFLAGNGTWQNGTNVCDWTISGQNLTAGHPTACHTGYVGIGRATPDRKLDVLVGDPSLIGVNGDFAAIRAVNSFTTTSTGRNIGIMGVSAELNPEGNIHTNIGGYFAGANSVLVESASPYNYGVIAIAND